MRKENQRGGSQKPIHRRRLVVEFLVVLVSRLHLEPAGVCWYGSSVVSGGHRSHIVAVQELTPIPASSEVLWRVVETQRLTDA